MVILDKEQNIFLLIYWLTFNFWESLWIIESL